MPSLLYLAFAVLVAVLGLAFYVRNDQDVVVNFFFGSVTLELALALVASLIAGALLGMLAMTASRLKLRRELKRLARQHAVAGRELASLRAITLKDAG